MQFVQTLQRFRRAVDAPLPGRASVGDQMTPEPVDVEPAECVESLLPKTITTDAVLYEPRDRVVPSNDCLQVYEGLA